MNIPESVWKEYYKNMQNLSMDQSLVSFGEEICLNDGTLGAIPLSPKQYKVRAEQWLRSCLKEVCPQKLAKSEFKGHLEPTNRDFLVGAVIGFGEHLEVTLKAAGHTGVLLEVGVVYTSIMIFKYGLTTLCELYCSV